jgi:hypothetical protein
LWLSASFGKAHCSGLDEQSQCRLSDQGAEQVETLRERGAEMCGDGRKACGNLDFWGDFLQLVLFFKAGPVGGVCGNLRPDNQSEAFKIRAKEDTSQMTL